MRGTIRAMGRSMNVRGRTPDRLKRSNESDFDFGGLTRSVPPSNSVLCCSASLEGGGWGAYSRARRTLSLLLFSLKRPPSAAKNTSSTQSRHHCSLSCLASLAM